MFRWNDCSEGHIIIGMILTLTSLICLILTTFSVPFIKGIHFLSVPAPISVKFGAFGYCPSGSGIGAGGDCVGPKVGYGWDGDELSGWAVKAMILFGIAAIFMLLALLTLILSLLKVGKFMWNPIYFRTTALLGSLFAILAEIFALILLVRARNRFDDIGLRAKYGAALWLGMVGAISAFLG
ncbi:hypothetical protein I317_05104 [Kwoniella heveanensis CBS 569]|uniref:Uncharacterized protein n=1 Tax=Kwoniella heveanensis BCC8398 TaxID=1296120 RepID=A0A1B9GXV9_9TREE|nr:hypothetical protein I316_02323 [Kwoniella heveanensis BCC8398]OCF41093.1 hypothetical protein I317_05104 [Kwoniella heveanensis CBS 569]